MKLVYSVLLFSTVILSHVTSASASSKGGKSSYDLSAASFSVSMATAPGPIITNFNPTFGAPGTEVAVAGSGFSDVVSANFGGAGATFIIDSDIQLRTTVPADGLSGQISLMNSLGGVGNSVGVFTVSPRITGFVPGSGLPGAIVNILGVNFAGASSVQFNGLEAASFQVISIVLVKATVPIGATTGLISVTNQAGTGTSAINFVVGPVISGFVPTADTVGKAVMISGVNFTGATAVKFNGTGAPFVVNSSTEIKAKVPRGAATGKITVTNSAGTDTSADDFTVFPGGGIGDFIWNDLDSSGSFTPGEPGFAGVKVNLREAGNDGVLGNGDDVIYSPVATDLNGNYSFDDLPGGFYRVDVDESTLPGAFALSAGVEPLDLTLNTGQKFLGVDFGYHEVTSRICVGKYFDANHNQQLDAGEVPVANVTFHLNGISNTFTQTTDATGRACFEKLPLDTYDLTEDVPVGYSVSSPPSGVMTLVTHGGEDTTVIWLNGAALDEQLFFTNRYIDWLIHTNGKGKFEPIKRKPDKVDFKFLIQAPSKATFVNFKFSMFTRGKVYSDTTKLLEVASWDNLKEVTYSPVSPIDSGRILQVDGRGFKGKPVKVSSLWGTMPKFTGQKVLDQAYKLNTPRLPMPNLQNAAEELFPAGFGQTSAYFTNGLLLGVPQGPKGGNSVLHLKYKDVQKSLYKDYPARHSEGTIRCLGTFDNGRPISAQQKSLPAKKQMNKLFGDLLALKLNAGLSASGKTPPGLGSLVYRDPTSPGNPFNSKTIDQIILVADTLISCLPLTSISPSPALDLLYNVIYKVNDAFSPEGGFVDTFSFAQKTKLRGVIKLKNVPYLFALPGEIPSVAEPSPPLVENAPARYRLEQNYPNPFNPTTTIQFELPEPGLVTLKIYNLLGQEVAILLANEAMEDGQQEIEFDATALASGVYFYRLVTEGIGDSEEGISGQTFVSVRKMLLVK